MNKIIGIVFREDEFGKMVFPHADAEFRKMMEPEEGEEVNEDQWWWVIKASMEFHGPFDTDEDAYIDALQHCDVVRTAILMSNDADE